MPAVRIANRYIRLEPMISEDLKRLRRQRRAAEAAQIVVTGVVIAFLLAAIAALGMAIS